MHLKYLIKTSLKSSHFLKYLLLLFALEICSNLPLLIEKRFHYYAVKISWQYQTSMKKTWFIHIFFTTQLITNWRNSNLWPLFILIFKISVYQQIPISKKHTAANVPDMHLKLLMGHDVYVAFLFFPINHTVSKIRTITHTVCYWIKQWFKLSVILIACNTDVILKQH